MNDDNVQRAVYSVLSGDAELMALATGGIYADLTQPPDAGDASAFPYISFGRGVTTPWDHKTAFGGQLSIQLDAWSRSNNYLEVKAIAARVHELLHHQPLTIDDCDHVWTRAQSVTYTPDVDGHTKRALMLYTVVISALR